MSLDAAKSPDNILSLINRNTAKFQQGKFKIFLGMAAGVGKTYAMLQAANQLLETGKDIVIGIVETHGRKGTVQALGSLASIPRKDFSYKGVTISEMDTDAIIARKPALVLVDELAHTNAPGSRHQKRYLDVLEILNAGIDVFATLNIQHIESRIDTVQEITNVTIHETIPDLILDRADEIVLIDLPPDDLIKRLSEGRIYAEDSAIQAAQNFFKLGNLTALREMALRIASERADRELRDFKTLNGIEGVWKTSGRLMVAIFASPYSEILIRWTRRVANLLGVTWIGAFVEGADAYTQEERELLSRNIALVRQIGGEIISTKDEDPAKGLLRIAHQNNVTQIIVGKSQRSFLKNFLSGGSLVNRLIKDSGNIDIYAVSTGRAKGRKYLKNKFRLNKPELDLNDLGLVAAIALSTWMFAGIAAPFTGYMAIGILFLLAVSLSGLVLSRASVFLLAGIFAAIHNYFFIPPKFTFSISKPEDFMILLMLFVAAAIVGHLTTRLTQKERELRIREDRALRLYSLAKDLASAQTINQILISSQGHLESALGTDVSIILKETKAVDGTKKHASDLTLSPKEQAVANWVLENSKIAGFGTETLSASEYTYFPIMGRTEIIGVLAAFTSKSKNEMRSSQHGLIESYLHQIASGLEREMYHEKVKNLLLLEETQKLYKSLLDCVSHELKTPLSAIKGAASALIDPLTSVNQNSVETLGAQILEASERLQRLVENLLDMTRIESGMMQPKRLLVDVGDTIATALQSIDRFRDSNRVSVHIEPNLPSLVCDPVLLNQVLTNILQNAFIYAKNDKPIEITANSPKNGQVTISIRDHGMGLPKENPSIVMDKFYRVNYKMAGGVGLGLSIAKGFMDAIGGTIEAGNHPQGGAEFKLNLQAGRPI